MKAYLRAYVLDYMQKQLKRNSHERIQVIYYTLAIK